MHASRNIAKCTKDCLCLFVCPTGATDTETGQIDAGKCIDGCRLCVDACPSHAIYLLYEDYPEPAAKDDGLTEVLLRMAERKYEQEKTAEKLAAEAAAPGGRKLAEALRRSFRILGEDCAREAGYMIPQCREVRLLLKEFAADNPAAESLFAHFDG